MALSVTVARTKERCGITDSAYDTVIDNLIDDVVPVVEFSLQEDLVADTANTGLQATLNLGALEIVCGEFMALKLREPGAADEVHIGEVAVVPYRGYDPADPFSLIRKGWKRLRPFLKIDPRIGTTGGVGGIGDRTLEEDL